MNVAVRFIGSLLLLGVSFGVSAQIPECQKNHCLAVVDAGSTGSRVHIYSYELDNTNTPINISEKWSRKIKPGFATLDANQAAIDNYLTALFTGAPESSLPVYFYSTAGMRLLPQPKQQQMYGYLQHWFGNQSQWQLQTAKTITGNEEGLYGWLSVNYQLGNFKQAAQNTVGVMDMGGASVQITFPVSAKAHIAPPDLQEFTLYGQHYSLFVHSFLGLGQTEVSHQFLDSSSCFITNYELPDGILAEGNAFACEGEVAPLLNSVHHVNEVVQPILSANPVKEWYSLGGVVELVKSKPFVFNNNQFDNQNLIDQANSDFCQQQWSAINSQYPNNEYVYGYCLFPAYYYALMVDGYGLQPEQPVHYLNADQSGDWTLGVVLHPKA